MKLFEKNIGRFDKITRIVLGFGALVIVALQYAQGLLAVVLAVLGTLLILTATMESCLLYSLVGIDTDAAKKKGTAAKSGAAPKKAKKRRRKK